jgi:hypothetical protein
MVEMVTPKAGMLNAERGGSGYGEVPEHRLDDSALLFKFKVRIHWQGEDFRRDSLRLRKIPLFEAKPLVGLL